MASYKPKFLKPNIDSAASSTPLDTERLNESEAQYEIAKYNPSSDTSIDIQRQQLPIFKYRNQILYALETHRVVIIGKLSQ
jgi:HrpA-like RNA helicase